MRCPTCQHDNPEGALFCNRCGISLGITCQRCRTQNPHGSQFCQGCGIALTETSKEEDKTATGRSELRSQRGVKEVRVSKRVWVAGGVFVFLLMFAVIGNNLRERQPSQQSPSIPVASVEKETRLAEKRRNLIKKCQQMLQSIPKMPLKQRKQMAALASEADEGIRGSGATLSGKAPALNPNYVEQALDDVEFFVNEIARCIESIKKSKTCTLSKDAQGVLRSYTDQDLSQTLKRLSSFCHDDGYATGRAGQSIPAKRAAQPSKKEASTVQTILKNTPGILSIREDGPIVWVDVDLTALGSPWEEKAKQVAEIVAGTYRGAGKKPVCVHVTSALLGKVLGKACRYY